MDPQATLERIRNAYGENNHAEIAAASVDLLAWIRRGGSIPTVDEPQLSALLIMALEYGKTKQVEQAPDDTALAYLTEGELHARRSTSGLKDGGA